MWSNKLKEEVIDEIKDRWYDVSWRFPTDDYIPEFIAGFRDGFKTGAQEYAIKWQTTEQWKKEANLLLDPLLEWGHAQKDIPLGSSITSEILRRAKLYTAAEAKADRYEKALRLIEQMSDPGDYYKAICEMKAIATEALKPKTDNDEHGL